MIVRMLTLILCLLPLAGHSETVVLRSGEHADFSRLVLQLNGQPKWEIGRVSQGYELRIFSEGIDFDTGGVFERISGERITGFARPSQERLVIKTSKGYHLDAFELRAGQIVIDIKNGPAPSNSVFEAALNNRQKRPEMSESRANTASQRQSNLGMFDQSVPSILGDPKENSQHSSNYESALETFSLPMLINSPRISNDAPLPLELPAERTERVIQMESALIEQLSRAASQGLIVADIADPQAAIQEIIAPQAKSARANTLPDDPPPGDLSHVRVKTRVDLDSREAIGKPMLSTSGKECLPATKFDISDWGPKVAPYLDLAEYRGALIGEFDTADSDKVGDLARYYIFLGFGAEAKSTLREFGVIARDADLLASMAEIMDQGQASSLGRLKGQLSCNTPSAMWSVLAAARIEKGDKINRVAVLQAFSALPLHLRRHLGPILSKRFLAIDDTDTVGSIRGAIQRAPGEHGAGFEMLDAKLELSLGHDDVAIRKLESLVRDGGSLASEALATLMKAKLAASEAIPKRMIEDAIASSFAIQNTPLGSELTALAVAATIQNGDAGEALDLIAHAAREDAVESETLMLLTNDAYLSLARNADDIEFMRRSLSPLAWDNISDLDSKPRRAIATRMLDLGFADEARDVLNVVQETPEREDRFLFARAALMQGSAQVAVGYLAGIDGVEAELMRARAFQAAKDETRAAEIFEGLDKISEAARSAWRGGDFSRVERIGSPQEQTVASLANEQPPNPELGLEKNRTLLAQSAASRAALNELIRSLPEP